MLSLMTLQKNMIWWLPFSAWTDWFVRKNGESIKCVVWHLVLLISLTGIRECYFISICYKNSCFLFWKYNWIIDQQIPSSWMLSKSDKMKYKMYCGASCFNRVIELNQKMLILSKFLTENEFLCDDDNWIVYKNTFVI
jgi:hypothetical protein